MHAYNIAIYSYVHICIATCIYTVLYIHLIPVIAIMKQITDIIRSQEHREGISKWLKTLVDS